MNLTIALNESGLNPAATRDGRHQPAAATWRPTVLPPLPLDEAEPSLPHLHLPAAHADDEPPTLTARLLAESSAVVWEDFCLALLLIGAAVPLVQCLGGMEALVNAWPQVMRFFSRLLA